MPKKPRSEPRKPLPEASEEEWDEYRLQLSQWQRYVHNHRYYLAHRSSIIEKVKAAQAAQKESKLALRYQEDHDLTVGMRLLSLTSPSSLEEVRQLIDQKLEAAKAPAQPPVE